jgi:hypothetical protein
LFYPSRFLAYFEKWFLADFGARLLPEIGIGLLAGFGTGLLAEFRPVSDTAQSTHADILEPNFKRVDSGLLPRSDADTRPLSLVLEVQ